MWMYDEEEENNLSYRYLREMHNSYYLETNNVFSKRVDERLVSFDDINEQELIKRCHYFLYDTLNEDSVKSSIEDMVQDDDYKQLDDILSKMTDEELSAVVKVYKDVGENAGEDEIALSSHIKEIATQRIKHYLERDIDTWGESDRELEAIIDIVENTGGIKEWGNDYAEIKRQCDHGMLINKSNKIAAIARDMRENLSQEIDFGSSDIRDLWDNLDISELDNETQLPVEGTFVSPTKKNNYFDVMLETAIAKVMHDNLQALEQERVVEENADENDNSDTVDIEIEDTASNAKEVLNLNPISKKELKTQIQEQLKQDIMSLYVANAVDQVAKMPELWETLGLNDLENPSDEPVAPTEEELADLSEEEKEEKLNEYNNDKQEYEAKTAEFREQVKEALGSLDQEKMEAIVKKLQQKLASEEEGQDRVVINPYLILDTASEREVALSQLRHQINDNFKGKETSIASKRVKEQENNLAQASRGVFGKLHDFSVGIRQLAKNDTAKAIEIISQLGVAGGNMVFAGISLFGGKEALAGAGGQLFAGVLAGAMVANQIAKGSAYPLYRAYKNLDGSRLSGFAKFKEACKEVKRKEPEAWINLASGVVAAGAWITVSAVASPLAGKIVAGGVVAIGNYIAKQKEFNRRKKLLKLLESSNKKSAQDIKLIAELRTELYGDKTQPKPKGLWGKIKNFMQPKKTQTTVAAIGAGFGALGIFGQVSNVMSNAADTATVVEGVSDTGVEGGNPVAEGDSTLVRNPADSTLVRNPADSTLVRNPADSTLVRNPADSTLVRNPADSTLVRNPADSTLVRNPADSTLVNNPVAEGGNPVAEGGNPSEFTPHTDEKTGMIVWQEAKTKGGVTETYLQDAKGNNFVRYEGLNTNHVVSEASYAKLIDTINSKGNTNFVMEDGSKYTFQEAVEMMREKLNANPDRLPEGIGTNRAIYLAMMRARYTGKLDIINDIKCNDNELTALVAESQKYATNPGHIGRLITERPLPTRVGPASAITDPCVPVNNLGVNEAPDAEILSAENDVNKLNITTEKVDMADPYAEVRTTFDGNKGDYLVNQESVDGEYEKTFKKDGSIWVDDKNGVTTTTGLKSNNREVHYHAPVDATPIINNLPDIPTSTETVDGVTTMTYKFESGKTIQVVLEPLKEGAEARTGHFFIEGKEYIIDANSSKALGEKISAPLGAEYQVVDGAEQDVSQHLTDNVKDLNKGISKLNDYIANIANKQEGAIAGQDISVEEYNARYTETGVENVTLTPEQTAEIRSKGEFICTGIKDGKATMAVTGVEGVDRIYVAEPTHINMAGASDAVVDVKDKVYTATITTQEGKNLVVSIDNNIDPSTNLPKGTSITYDGKPVVLGIKTATAVEQSVEKAFGGNNFPVDVKTHTPFTEKLVKAAEAWKAKSEGIPQNGKGISVTTLRNAIHVAEK